MSALRVALAAVFVLAAVACNNNNNGGVAFPFERAEHLTFACFAPLAARNTEFVTLPMECCKLHDASSKDEMPSPPPYCQQVGSDPVGTALLHALVTQSTRGEVAAVDLVNNRVLDSDRLVPGYTFLDTGGLPSAIVVPDEQPRTGEPVIHEGPQWTYVASAEEFEVRAIATCRFVSGGACGPDKLDENKDPGYAQRTRFPLPAAPRDMLLAPKPGLMMADKQALWVTLPDLGLVARIELAESRTVKVGGLDTVKSVEPFAMNAQGTLNDPAFFRVPSAAGVVPAEPKAEESEYTAICGLGHEFKSAKRTLPKAPPDPPTLDVQPNLMHYDELSKRLLVTDRVAPVLHVFSFDSEGKLVALPPLATGTVVRDFVLTPPVPANKPVDLLVDPAPAEDPKSETKKRYLYAIDGRGLLMVFEFLQAGEDGPVSVQPLLAPTPGVGFADRIDLPAPVTALAIIDTRTSSDYTCGEQPVAELHRQLDEQSLKMPRDAALQASITQLQSRIDLHDLAGANYLHGVFLAAASANGTLSIIDVHDLDVACRARKNCCQAEACRDAADLQFARDPSSQNAVAVRRHAVRRAFVGQLETVIPNPDLIAESSCHASGDPFVQVPGDSRTCAPADPWTAESETWNVVYQGSIPNTQTRGAAFQKIDESFATVLAPVGFNFCDAGVVSGDLIAVLGDPPERLLSRCGQPTADNASLYEITELRADRATVKLATTAANAVRRSIDEITTCYPDNVGIEVRAGGFLVLGASGTYLHRGITAPDGTCAVDTTKDAQITARPTLADGTAPGPQDLSAQVFKNPFIEFTLAPGTNSAQQALRNTALQLRNGSSGLAVTSVVSGNTTADALPVALQYDSRQSRLYLLDTASQGLRRYLLNPFQFDTTSFH